MLHSTDWRMGLDSVQNQKRLDLQKPATVWICQGSSACGHGWKAILSGFCKLTTFETWGVGLKSFRAFTSVATDETIFVATGPPMAISNPLAQSRRSMWLCPWSAFSTQLLGFVSGLFLGIWECVLHKELEHSWPIEHPLVLRSRFAVDRVS